MPVGCSIYGKSCGCWHKVARRPSQWSRQGFEIQTPQRLLGVLYEDDCAKGYIISTAQSWVPSQSQVKSSGPRPSEKAFSATFAVVMRLTEILLLGAIDPGFTL